MVLLRLITISTILITLCGCQIGYIAESAYYQADLLRRRVPLQYAIDNYNLTEDQKTKLELAIIIRKFMKEKLGLKTDTNYTRYVHLDRDYVTYVVSAAPKNELKQYTWSFPIVGSVPYKGYFKKESAKEEERKLASLNLDTNLRGVSAFSTLGWFEDPILSSMLNYKEENFVSTLIHETVHANLYIKGRSKFNERVATFLGQLGAEAFYKEQNKDNVFRKKMASKSHDSLLFSQFITTENKNLKDWYHRNKDKKNLLQLREFQFTNIKERFDQNILPKMKTKNYAWFSKRKINNALLLLLGLYNSDFSDLEKLANKNKRNFKKTFQFLKSLENKEKPENFLKDQIK